MKLTDLIDYTSEPAMRHFDDWWYEYKKNHGYSDNFNEMAKTIFVEGYQQCQRDILAKRS